MSTVADYLNSLIKDRDSIVAKFIKLGVDVSADLTFTEVPDKMDFILSKQTQDATASAADILLNKTAYSNGQKITGTLATYAGDTSVDPGQDSVTLSTEGTYLSSDITVNGVANLLAENIKLGEIVGGVTGTYSGTEYETYEGPYEVTPGKDSQTSSTKGKLMSDDFVVDGDENLIAGNIRKDVEIFGVTGEYEGSEYPTYSGSYDVDPSTETQTLSTENKLMAHDVIVQGDENLVTENIKAGTSIFGVAGKSTVVDTYTDDNASAGEVREGSVAFVNGKQITGTAKELSTKTYVVSTEDQAINSDPSKESYIILRGNSLVVQGEPDLIADNIKDGVTIGSVTGTLVGADFTQTTATTSDVLSGKKFYNGIGELVEGTIQTYNGDTTVTPTTSDVTLSTKETYVDKDITVSGDENLLADNIKLGTTIFGVEGSYSGSSYETYTGDTTLDSTNVDFSTGDTVTLETKDKIVAENIELDKDTNLIAENIKKDVTIYGVTGTYDGGSKGNINFLDCSSMTSAADVVTAYSDLYSIQQGTSTSFSTLAAYDYSTNPLGAAYVQNLAGIEFHHGTGIMLYNEKITIESTQLIMKLIYYVSTWINPTIAVNLISAADLDEAKTKALAGEYVATRSVTLSNTFNKQSVFYEFDSTLEVGDYYICLSVPTTPGGNEAILSYAEMIQL